MSALVSTIDNFIYMQDVATITKISWRTRFWKIICVKGVTCCRGNAIFDAV